MERNRIRQAVIMAGGKGTRLASVTKDIPKPMVPIDGKPILEYQVENLRAYGITDIHVIVGHLSHVIKDFLGDGSKWGVSITYFEEDKPLGTAGALPLLYRSLDDEFLLLMGDLFIAIDFKRYIAAHKRSRASISILTHPNSHPYDSDLLGTDPDGYVRKWLSKNDKRGESYSNLVNAGIYIINRDEVTRLSRNEKHDLDKELIVPAIMRGTVYAYRSTEYVKDVGTPGRLKQVENDQKKGLPECRRLNRSQKCIFLDRDGTLNVYKGFLTKERDMELEATAADAVGMINQSEYLAVVVSNQPVIARGEVTYEELTQINNRMETLLGDEGVYLDRIYFCPHHPDKGYEGEVPELKIMCNCRKPAIGMLKQAEKELNINLSQSWIIGDMTGDIQTGVNAGTHTALVMTGEAGRDGKYEVKPEIIGVDLVSCVRQILSKS